MLTIDKINFSEELKRARVLPGKERICDIKMLLRIVGSKYGDSGVEKLKREVVKAGYNVPDIINMNDMGWMSMNLANTFLIKLVEIFNWRTDEVIEFAKAAPAMHQLNKIFLRYFVSIKKVLARMGYNWKIHYSVGDMEMTHFDNKKQEAKIVLKDFKAYPLLCSIYNLGIIIKIVEVATGSKKVKVEETKCPYRGDRLHEYSISW